MTIRAYEPMQAYNYGVFVENAYRMFAASPGSLTPPVLPIFPSSYELVLYLTAVDHILGETESKFFGFVARSQASPADYVVAIRGTEHLIEWLIDTEFGPTAFSPVPPAGDVEDGFFSIYRTLGGVLPNGRAADLHQFIRESAGKGSLTIAGHSLGAALAIMLALDVAVNSPVETLTLYTLAAPRVGGEHFRTCFNQRVPRSYRVYNEPDMVPKLPPLYQQLDAGEEIDSKDVAGVKHSLACYHTLVTYLYVLNPQSMFPLASCGPTPPGSRSTASP